MLTEKKKQIRSQILEYFRKVAREENQKIQGNVDFETLLDKDEGKKRVLVTMPESIGDIFLVTSLFESIRKRYPSPEWVFYFACNNNPAYIEILDGNPYIDKVIPYIPQLDNFAITEGAGAYSGLFQVAYTPHFSTQRMVNYVHNSLDSLDINNKS